MTMTVPAQGHSAKDRPKDEMKETPNEVPNRDLSHSDSHLDLDTPEKPYLDANELIINLSLIHI